MAKGAAMLSPAMATMLAVLTTDARVEPGVLRRALADAVSTSFDRLCVDGCRSTNDTVAVLASGQAGGPLVDSHAAARDLTEACERSCASLAEQMARDAEGATKFVRSSLPVLVPTADARRRRARDRVVAARAVSLYGGDPYWARALRDRRERRVLRPGAGRHRLQRGHGLPRRNRVRPRRGRARGGHGRSRDQRALGSCISVTARRPCSPPTSSPAYIDENMRTS